MTQILELCTSGVSFASSSLFTLVLQSFSYKEGKTNKVNTTVTKITAVNISRIFIYSFDLSFDTVFFLSELLQHRYLYY